MPLEIRELVLEEKVKESILENSWRIFRKSSYPVSIAKLIWSLNNESSCIKFVSELLRSLARDVNSGYAHVAMSTCSGRNEVLLATTVALIHFYAHSITYPREWW